jgi:thiamine-phosphate pyrophosphorylase
MIRTLPRVYAITDVKVSGLSHTEQARRLIAGGATLIQLREKNLRPREFYQETTTTLDVARQSGAVVIINDRVDIAAALDAGGVHLGQDDLPPDAARELLGEQAIIGLSTHNVEQAGRAVSMPVDYIAIGPVFETETKSDTEPSVGLEGVRAVRRAVGRFPMVAIGGITFENAPSVLAAGADSVAVISALLGRAEAISSRTLELLNHLGAPAAF